MTEGHTPNPREPQSVSIPIRSTPMSLRTRMTLSFVVLFAVILVLVSLIRTFGLPWTSDRGSYGDAQELVLKQLTLMADLKKEILLHWLEERESDATTLSQRLVVASALNTYAELVRKAPLAGRTPDKLRADFAKEKSARVLTNALNMMPISQRLYQKVHVIDAETGLVIASTEEKDLGVRVSDQSSFSDARKDSDRTSFVIARSPVTGSADLVVSRAVVDKSAAEAGGETKVLGVVMLHVEGEQFMKPLLYNEAGMGNTAEILLVNQDRRIITSLKSPLPTGAEARPLEYQIESQPATLAARGENGIMIGRDYRDVPVLAAYRHIKVAPDMGWGMVIKVDQDEILGPTRGRILNAWVISLLGVIAVAVMAALLAGRVARPIDNLSLAAREVQAGNFDARADVVSSDEVGNLATTFNSMIERIQNWHKDLEDQIASRTVRLTELNEELTAEAAQRKRHEKERERLIAELEAKNAELERFAYTVSHDLKSPLITIKGFLRYLERDMASGNLDRLRADSDRIAEAVEKMGQLLDELLELSRIGRIMNPPQEVPLDKLLQTTLETLAGSIAARKVVVDIAEDLPVLYGDAVRLREVVENLLDNAIKFLGDQPHPRVEIGVRRETDTPVIYFKDNGIGIDPRYHTKIFGLFERLNQDTQGTGIGLAIVRRIVEVHGGTIWVESEGIGHGSVFCFTLPKANDAGTAEV
jgi:signal transduction histidine kinase